MAGFYTLYAPTLHTFCISNDLPLPLYIQSETIDSPHPLFICRAKVNNSTSIGTDVTQDRAKQRAAGRLLDYLSSQLVDRRTTHELSEVCKVRGYPQPEYFIDPFIRPSDRIGIPRVHATIGTPVFLYTSAFSTTVSLARDIAAKQLLSHISQLDILLGQQI